MSTEHATEPLPSLRSLSLTHDSCVAFFLLWMGVLCLVYLVLALRTNVVFVLIFFWLVIAFGCLAGAYWHLANAYADPRSAADPTFAVASELATAGRCAVAGGAFCFLVCLLGWWIFSAIMLAALDFPFQIPGKCGSVGIRD